MSSVTFRGVSVSRADALRALAAFGLANVSSAMDVERCRHRALFAATLTFGYNTALFAQQYPS